MKKCVYKKICKVYNRKKCSSKYSYENNNCSLVDIKIDKKIIKKSIEKNISICEQCYGKIERIDLLITDEYENEVFSRKLCRSCNWKLI